MELLTAPTPRAAPPPTVARPSLGGTFVVGGRSPVPPPTGKSRPLWMALVGPRASICDAGSGVTAEGRRRNMSYILALPGGSAVGQPLAVPRAVRGVTESRMGASPRHAQGDGEAGRPRLHEFRAARSARRGAASWPGSLSTGPCTLIIEA